MTTVCNQRSSAAILQSLVSLQAELQDPNSATCVHIQHTIMQRIRTKLGALHSTLISQTCDDIAHHARMAANTVSVHSGILAIFDTSGASVDSDAVFSFTKDYVAALELATGMRHTLSKYGTVSGPWLRPDSRVVIAEKKIPPSGDNTITTCRPCVPSSPSPRRRRYTLRPPTIRYIRGRRGNDRRGAHMLIDDDDDTSTLPANVTMGNIPSTRVHASLLHLPDSIERQSAIGLFVQATADFGTFTVDDAKMETDAALRVRQLRNIVDEVVALCKTTTDMYELLLSSSSTHPRHCVMQFVHDIVRSSIHPDASRSAAIPEHLNILIKGEPGTGKTELARIIGHLYHATGQLLCETMKVTTCSSFIAEYVGQTPGKTHRLLSSCIEGTVFLDESHAMSRSGEYAAEAISTIVGFLTQHMGKICFIAAGYPSHISDGLLALDAGLQRRFSTTFTLVPFTPRELARIYDSKLELLTCSIHPDAPVTLRLTKLDTSHAAHRLLRAALQTGVFCGGAGDMQVLAMKAHKHQLLINSGTVTISCMREALTEFCDRHPSQDSRTQRLCSILAFPDDAWESINF